MALEWPENEPVPEPLFEVVAEGIVHIDIRRNTPTEYDREMQHQAADRARAAMENAEIAMREYDSLGLPMERADETGKRNVAQFWQS